MPVPVSADSEECQTVYKDSLLQVYFQQAGVSGDIQHSLDQKSLDVIQAQGKLYGVRWSF